MKRTLVRYLLAGYLILLGISHIVRLGQPEFSPRADQQSVSLLEWDSGEQTGRSIQLSFVDAGGTGTPVFLLHGSPAASPFMMRLHDALARTGYRVITPDLPGFAGSTKVIKDYSFASHSRYIEALADSLAIDSAYYIGYSMSGGVSTHLAERSPDRVKGLIFLSAIGVQELELLGDYHLNHSVHGLQLAGLWLLTEAVPHFGWLDDAMLSVQYARNFFDSDQRPLRSILSEHEGPTLIIHGSEDVLVPFSAAIEHYRIIPQSVLETIEGAGHGLPISHPDEVAEIISDWVLETESSARPLPSQRRLSQAAAPFDAASLPPVEGFSLAILMVLIALATFASEDLASIGAGLMVARGTFQWEHALIAVFAGILLGDIALYMAGRFLGRRVASLPPFSWFVSEHKMDRGAAWFEKKGAKVIIASRFIPGSRLPTYVAAGVLKAPFWKFLGYFLIATIFWTPFIVGISAVLGNEILAFWGYYEAYAVWVMIGLLAAVYALFHIGLPMTTHVGRRNLLSTWRRISRWEFWPPLVFYPPVVLWIGLLAIRYRSLTLFTASNPGIPEGGFVGESKFQILNLLRAKKDANVSSTNRIAYYIRLISGESHQAKISSFMELHKLSFPLVLKPDVGERGHGVFIASSLDETTAYMREATAPVIAQEFIEGIEYGVFYVRQPDEPNGRIISITEKQLIHVKGDGVRNLERLILDDDRAVCLAPLFLKRFASELDRIPDVDERISLVDVGTHARGALFLNANHLHSESLVHAFNKLVGHNDGFYFGRFDVRVPDAESLTLGRDIRILELNGVTSEATHIYDPKASLWAAYATLFEQWHLAFEIGRKNVGRGAKKASLLVIMKSILQYKVRPINRPDTSAPAKK